MSKDMCPPSASDDASSGKINGRSENRHVALPDVAIDWVEGNCPVQAEGTIDGKEFYFRARYTHWRLEIGEWNYAERYSDEPYAAGWMTEEEARTFIAKAAALYKAEQPSDGPLSSDPAFPMTSESEEGGQ